MIVPPLRPTWRRWRRHAGMGTSLCRGLMYERLESVELRGRCLDVGGGARAGYRQLLPPDAYSLNIDPGVRPSVVADLNRALPFRDGVFDTVITLNTLEHVRDDTLAARELLRMLKSGGRFHIMVPFLYRLHGSPSDYHRHTGSWWEELLVSEGASPESIEVEPLSWDPLSTAFSIVDFTPLRRLLRPLVLLVGLILGRLDSGRGRRMGPRAAALSSVYPVGYYVTGRT